MTIRRELIDELLKQYETQKAHPERQNRGVKDIFIACVDGLTGLPEAIETVYPQARVQLCMVHLMRNSLRYVSYKHMKAVATDLKAIYGAGTETEAEFNLELFAEKWDALYPTISKSWRARLSARDPVICLSRGYSQGDLYHQCYSRR